MAFVPLAITVLPRVVETVYGVGMGVMDASKAHSSGWTLTIGNKVFTTAKPFPFDELPFELREDIILRALEASKSRLPPPDPLPPGHPFLDPGHKLFKFANNPHHPDFVNAAGERARNEHPASSWRWTRLSREWCVVVRPRLWAHTILRGPAQYKGFLRLLAREESKDVGALVKMLVLGPGWGEDHLLYEAMRALPGVDALAYKPPPVAKTFEPFGLHLVPTTPGPIKLELGVPLDRVTTAAGRAHLLALPRLAKLSLALTVLTPEHAAFLLSLPHLTDLELRLPSLHPAQLEPFLAPVDDSTHPCARLTGLELRARTIHDDVAPALVARIEADARLARITSVFRIPAPPVPELPPRVLVALLGGPAAPPPPPADPAADSAERLLVYAPPEGLAAARERAEERAALAARGRKDKGRGNGARAEGGPGAQGGQGAGWREGPHGLLRTERTARETTTDVRLLGGLLRLNMQARR